MKGESLQTVLRAGIEACRWDKDVSHLKQQVGFLLGVKKRKQKRLERSQDNLETLRMQLTMKAS